MNEGTLSPHEGFVSAGVPASLLEYLHGCPICSHTELHHYCRVPSLFNVGQSIHYERCAGCGTVLRNPRLPAAYRESKYENKVLPPEQKLLDPRNQAHYSYMMRLIRRLLPEAGGRRLLDFGCGAGGFLVAAREAGFEVMGLELNHDLACHVERTYDIPVFQGLVDDIRFAGEGFTVIVSSQVFEHLVDPRGTLDELCRHLEMGGLLLIEVPNLGDIRERLHRGTTMDDSHLFYFSARSLCRMLSSAGFRVLKVQQGLRPYRILGRYASRVPDPLHELGLKLFSACQLRTGLSVLARLDQGT